MDPQNLSDPQTTPDVANASLHVTEAKSLLATLRKRLGQHPELDEAIEKLEMALAVLTAHSGGML